MDEPPSKAVYARPDPALWFAVLGATVLSGILFAALLVPNRQGDATPLFQALFLTLPVFVAGLCLAFWISLNKIVATGTGIHWRRGLRRYSVSWRDITDYYLAKGSGQCLNYEISLSSARRILWGQDWKGAGALADCVRSRACIAETQEWERKGVRLRDLPAVFCYDLAPLRKEIGLSLGFGGFFLLLIGGVGACLAFSALRQDSLCGTVFMGSFVVITVAFVESVAAVGVRDALNARRRIGESWTLHPEGFVFREISGEAHAVPWETVVNYDLSATAGVNPAPAPPARVRTDSGREYSFYRGLAGYDQMCAIIRKRATNGIEHRIDQDSRNALGGIAARWTGGVEGQGCPVYHAQTRANAVWLAIAPMIAAVPAAELVMCWLGLIVDNDIRGSVSILVASVIVEIVAVAVFRSIRVVLEAEGFAIYLPWSRRFVAWNSIRDVTSHPSGGIRVDVEGHKPVHLWTNSLAYGRELEDRIRERSHSAASRDAVSPERQKPCVSSCSPANLPDAAAQVVASRI